MRLKTATSQNFFRPFATHGPLNNEHPELLGLVLSLVDEAGKDTDGFLRLVEIYNLKLPAELVVLNACKTGLGKEVKDEGLMSLTRGGVTESAIGYGAGTAMGRAVLLGGIHAAWRAALI